MSYQESTRLEYLSVLLELIEGGHLSFQDASAQYWEDFGKWGEIKEKNKRGEE